jgi:uncharacterized cupredoxin-like copper-binding protein
MNRPSPTRARRTNSVVIAVVVAAVTLIAAGCGSSKSSSSSATTTATTAASATTAAPATTAAGAATTAASTTGTKVTAAESEFKIELGASTFAPGTYIFDATNNGSFKHNITIDGPGVEDVKTDNIDPGKSGSVQVTLAAGTYEIYCSIPTHKAKGMDLTITVA